MESFESILPPKNMEQAHPFYMLILHTHTQTPQYLPPITLMDSKDTNKNEEQEQDECKERKTRE